MRKYVVIAYALLALPVHADQVKTFTFQRPTTNTDGSPLAVAQIESYTLTCNPMPASVSATVPGDVQTFQRTFPPGTFACNLMTRHTNGNVSAPSNQVGFTVPQPTPNPAADFSVD